MSNALIIFDWSDKSYTIVPCTWHEDGRIEEGVAIGIQLHETLQSFGGKVTLENAAVFLDTQLSMSKHVDVDPHTFMVSTGSWSTASKSRPKYSYK